MELKTRFAVALCLFVNASVHADMQSNWILAFNRAQTVEEYEAAAEGIESDYISISAEAISPLVPAALPVVHPTTLEREFAWFYISMRRLDRYQETHSETDLTAFEVVVRHLVRHGTADLHLMSKLMIARARELENVARTGKPDYDIGYPVPIPLGMARWQFYVGAGADPFILLNDLRPEYQPTIEARKPSPLAGIFGFLGLGYGYIATVRYKVERQLEKLEDGMIWLEIYDDQGTRLAVDDLRAYLAYLKEQYRAPANQ